MTPSVPATTVPRGRLLARANRANTAVELRASDNSSPIPFNRVGDSGFEFLKLSPGEYRLTAHLDGWADISQTIALSENQDIEVPVEFVGGALRIESDPSNAVVRIGGKIMGRTPMVIKDLPPGPQTLALQYMSWSELNVVAAVEAKRETSKTVRIPYGQMNIDSSPTGAAVFIDDEELGHTPIMVPQIPSGKRQLRLTADNYEPYETSINIIDHSVLRIQPRLASNISLLDPNKLLNSVWVSNQPTGRNYEVAPGFERTSAFRPKNGVVKNLDRQKLYASWDGHSFRYIGILKQFDSKAGTLDFAEESGDKSKYKITALLSVRGRADKYFLNKLLKGARIEVTGRLAAVEEPRWPSKTIVFELSEAEPVN